MSTPTTKKATSIKAPTPSVPKAQPVQVAPVAPPRPVQPKIITDGLGTDSDSKARLAAQVAINKAKAAQNEAALKAAKGGVTKTNTKTVSGGETSRKSVKEGSLTTTANGLGLSNKRSVQTTTGTGAKARTTGASVEHSVSAGPGNVSLATKSTQTKTVNGTTATNSSGKSASVQDGALTLGGSASRMNAPAAKPGKTTGASGSGSVTVGKDKLGAKAKVGFNVKGVGVSFEVDVSATRKQKQTTKNGVTRFNVDTELTATASTEAGVGEVSLGLKGSKGNRTSFEVAVPQQLAKNVDLAKLNPSTPEDLPAGASIRLDSERFKGSEIEATYKALKVSGSVEEANGKSLLIEKTAGNMVRVTAGPTEALRNTASFGLDFKAAGVSLVSNTSLKQASLTSATFDLSKPEGRKAYEAFVFGGKAPMTSTRIERLDVDSSAAISAHVGPIKFGASGATSHGEIVKTTQPDGSVEIYRKVLQADRVDVAVSEKLGAGNKPIGEKTYQFSLSGKQATALLRVPGAYVNDLKDRKALDAVGDALRHGTATYTVTESQLQDLLAKAKVAEKSSEYPNFDLGLVLYNDYDHKKPVTSANDFAINLARAASDDRFAAMLLDISNGADGNLTDQNRVALPGSFAVVA